MSLDTPHSQDLIAFTNVHYQIGDNAVINDLNLHINHRRVGVVGRNGSGKSSFARLLCGLVSPSSGTVQVAGVDVANDRAAAISTVGMLFQNPDHQIIFPTVEEELCFGLKQLGESEGAAVEAAKHALNQFGYGHWAQKSVSTLSQGQRHLVCLMAVLLMKPKLVVLDEPYAGLDIPTTMQLVKYLHKIDAAIVHISHQPDMLAEYDHVVWIDGGKLVQQGDPNTVLSAFSKEMKRLGESDVVI